MSEALEIGGVYKPTILVIEDSHTQALHLQALLAQEEPNVALAFDGKAGLEMARRLLPDVVILDVQMPEMDSIQAQHLLYQERVAGVVLDQQGLDQSGHTIDHQLSLGLRPISSRNTASPWNQTNGIRTQYSRLSAWHRLQFRCCPLTKTKPFQALLKNSSGAPPLP